MRRFFLAAAILSIVATGPLQAHAGDREIAEQIIQKLKVQRDAGSLKGFTLDLKVDKGVVLLRGSVQEAAQKQNVLAVAKDIEGIVNVVDEITVAPVVKPAETIAKTEPAKVIRPQATIAAAPAIAVAAPAIAAAPAVQPTKPVVADAPSKDRFSFKEALAAANAPVSTKAPAKASTQAIQTNAPVAQASKPASWQPFGGVEMAAAVESESSVETDRAITSSVVAALGTAQRQGRLKGFGVDVNTQDGRVYVTGRASSEQHRQLITELARNTAGVVDVVDEIAVYNSTNAMPAPVLATDNVEPLPLADYAPNLTPVAVEPVSRGASRPGTPAIAASARPVGVPVQAAPYQMQQGQPMQAMPAGMAMNAGVVGSPMPMAPYAGGAAAPRYEQPYLPNYAWPGYAAYPNYAAVTYPQQYSPSAWPYIGPFYPYPQVPLGWRKVSLEWDDGWWMLDFTDR